MHNQNSFFLVSKTNGMYKKKNNKKKSHIVNTDLHLKLKL